MKRKENNFKVWMCERVNVWSASIAYHVFKKLLQTSFNGHIIFSTDQQIDTFDKEISEQFFD